MASALLQRAVLGDHAALTELLAKHAAELLRILEPQVPARQRAQLSAEDILQQSLAEVFEEIDRFNSADDDGFFPWLRTIAQRNLTDAVRALNADKRGGRIPHFGSAAWDDSACNLFASLAASGSSPSRQVLKAETAGLVRTAVAQLPAAYSQVLDLHEFQGLTIEETAAKIGCSVGAVLMRRSRARTRLREILQLDFHFQEHST